MSIATPYVPMCVYVEELLALRMCTSCSLLPTPQINEVLSAVLLVMVWPYPTMIFIYDKYRSYSEFCVQCSKKDYEDFVLVVDYTQNSSKINTKLHLMVILYNSDLPMILMVYVNLWVW